MTHSPNHPETCLHYVDDFFDDFQTRLCRLKKEPISHIGGQIFNPIYDVLEQCRYIMTLLFLNSKKSVLPEFRNAALFFRNRKTCF